MTKKITKSKHDSDNKVLYSFSAQNKERLKWSIFIHYILLFLMLTKLMPEVLDKFDVFVLEVEELFVPKVKRSQQHCLAQVIFDILAPDMGVAVASINTSYHFWSLCLQALKFDVH